MTTKLITIRQFAQQMSKLLREAQENNIHFVIMRHGKPVANVTPFFLETEQDLIDDGIDVEALKSDIALAREQAKRGEGYSTEEVLRMLDA
jgi:antitoxin (DNA-binding transcriptional repressor) of toxin-antitoxin stability system